MKLTARLSIGAGFIAAFWGMLVLADQLSEGVRPQALANIQFGNRVYIDNMPVADTRQRQENGLKGKTNVDNGMLFIWPEERNLYFWMKNTPQPLSVAFFDADYRITGIQAMQPHSETVHASPGPALGAIELPQGAFQDMGVYVGMLLEISLGEDQK